MKPQLTAGFRGVSDDIWSIFSPTGLIYYFLCAFVSFSDHLLQFDGPPAPQAYILTVYSVKETNISPFSFSRRTSVEYCRMGCLESSMLVTTPYEEW